MLSTNFVNERLDFDIIRDNKESCFWPAIFSSIPDFDHSLPDEGEGNMVYIRGLANFIDSSTLTETSPPPTAGDAQDSPLPAAAHSGTLKYHPFLGMRLRGVIHSIEAQPKPGHNNPCVDDDNPDPSIPGWSRIVSFSPANLW
jgi:hypothetical protein